MNKDTRYGTVKPVSCKEVSNCHAMDKEINIQAYFKKIDRNKNIRREGGKGRRGGG